MTGVSIWGILTISLGGVVRSKEGMRILTEEEQQLYDEMKKNGELWSCMVGSYSPIDKQVDTYKDNRDIVNKFNKRVDNE